MSVHDQVSVACERYKSLLQEDRLLIVGAIYDFRNDYHHGEGHFFIINKNGIAITQ